MKALVNHFRAPALRGAVLTLLIVVASACGATRELRKAQTSFNRAASLDNAAQLGGGGMPTVTPGESRQATRLAFASAAGPLYAEALGHLDGMNEKERAQIEADGLDVQVDTLRALCHWRLGDYETARNAALDAAKRADSVAEPRDHALLIALPGLIKSDQAFDEIAGWGTALEPLPTAEDFGRMEKLLLGENGAMEDLRRARDAIGDRPLLTYLIQAQLVVLSNLRNARDRAQVSPVQPGSVVEHARSLLVELDERLEATMGDAERDSFVDLWSRALGVQLPEEPSDGN